MRRMMRTARRRKPNNARAAGKGAVSPGEKYESEMKW